MPKFKIEIEEILQRVEEIEANNLEDALDKAEEKYLKGEIVLDYEDFKEHEIREYRSRVQEEDLVKDSIIPLNYGQAILLEGNKDLALLKQIGKDFEPYVIVTNLQPHRKYGTYFEWDNGSYFNSITEASKEYEKRVNINKHLSKIDYTNQEKQKMLFDILKDIEKFGQPEYINAIFGNTLIGDNTIIGRKEEIESYMKLQIATADDTFNIDLFEENKNEKKKYVESWNKALKEMRNITENDIVVLKKQENIFKTIDMTDELKELQELLNRIELVQTRESTEEEKEDELTE